MARKKTETTDVVEEKKDDGPVDYRKSVMALIEKQFGKKLVKSGAEFLEQENAKKIISISPSLDLGCGGGIPEGSWVIFAGKHKCGKTVTILHFAKKCQEAGKHVYYLNIEGRLKKMNLVGTFGLDPNLLDVIESTEEKTLNQTDYLNMAENIIRMHPACVIIFDSYSMLCPEKELTEGVGTSTMGNPAAQLAQFFRQMAGVVPAKRTIVVGINQIMANIGWMKSGDTEKGGKAIQYQGDVKFRFKLAEPWKDGEKEIGKIVTWIVEFNALGNGALPGSEVKSYLRYGHGLDETQELFNVAKDCGLIEGTSWYTLSFMKDHLDLLKYDETIEEKDETTGELKQKVVQITPAWDEDTMKSCKAQGIEKIIQLLKDNSEWLVALRKDVGELLGF